MKIAEEYINPCRSRYVVRYNSLSEDQQAQWDAIDSLPKEALHFKPIKRSRKPELKAGTIFAMQLPENLFLFGKVIADQLNLPNIGEGNVVAFISNILSRDLYGFPTELTRQNILTGPIIIDDCLWRNGIFYTVGHEEVTSGEKSIPYGFYCINYRVSASGKMVDNGFIVDVSGRKLTHEPEYLAICGYVTITGIETEIRREIIANPDWITNI